MIKFVLLLSLALVSTTWGQTCPADFCPTAPAGCQLPDCACAVSEPDGIPLQDRPQIVYLSFDDAMTQATEDKFFLEIFGEGSIYKNPNGCPIRATHFITHQSNDYSLNHLYQSMGHEIASHSVTHRSNTTYWATLPQDGWVSEFGGMKEMLTLYGAIWDNRTIGVRAPYLQGGGERQFRMMESSGFLYDCSQPNQQYGYTNMENGIWPYSLDFATEINCQVEPCPRCSYPGVWVQPMLDLEDEWYGVISPDAGVPCPMLDQCTIPTLTTPESVKDMLEKNFLRAYNGNTRAPFGVYMHASWFYVTEATGNWHYEGYKQFLQMITSPPYNQDTWIVPIKDGIEYRRNPVPNAMLDNFEPFQCETDQFPAYNCQPIVCPYYNVTNADLNLGQVNMKICQVNGEPRCPRYYPWLDDVEGIVPPPVPIDY